jgi:hypothetical protein
MRRSRLLLGLVIVAGAACSNTDRNFGEGSAGSSAAAGFEASAGAGAGASAGHGGSDGSAGAPDPVQAGSAGMLESVAGNGGGSTGSDRSEGGAAGASISEAAGAAGESVEATPPTIVSESPANDATGVAATTPLKLVFSEAMDTSSVEAALSISTFAAGELQVSWASGSKSVSILPTGGWKYATGTNPALIPLKYTVTIGAGAKDAQGDALSAFSWSFSTRRRLTQTLAATSVGSYSDYGHAVGDGPLMCAAETDNVILEKWSSVGSAGTYYAFIAFDAAALGASGASHTIEAASLRATQTAGEGDFYAAHQVVAAKVAYHAIDKDVLGATITSDLGAFASSAKTLHPSIDVLTSFKSDFDAGKNLHLFRLAPNLGPADSTVAHFSCGGFTLEVTHVLP